MAQLGRLAAQGGRLVMSMIFGSDYARYLSSPVWCATYRGTPTNELRRFWKQIGLAALRAHKLMRRL
jgi:hypothetical protein